MKDKVDLDKMERLWAAFNTPSVRIHSGWTPERHDLTTFLLDNFVAIRDELREARATKEGE